MSSDIISAHLISAFTAEIQALNSAGGIMSECGHNIMSSDIISAHLVSAFAAEIQAPVRRALS